MAAPDGGIEQTLWQLTAREGGRDERLNALDAQLRQEREERAQLERRFDQENVSGRLAWLEGRQRLLELALGVVALLVVVCLVWIALTI